MKIEIQYTIKAILSGVDETVIDHLDFGNSYSIVKDSLTNYKLWEEFDYTSFGIRRIYETSKLNNQLEIALLTKNICINYDVAETIYNDEQALNFEQIDKCISDFENKELNYVDETMRHIRLFSENCFNIKELLFKCDVVNLDDKSQIISNINSKIPLPDKILDNISKLHIENDAKSQKINNFIKTIDTQISSSNFSPEIIKQACFLYDQSYTAPVETLRFMVCVIAMESILVKGNLELSYRFSRNGAMLLSNNVEEYWQYSNIFKEIYKKRSNYVHTGKLDNLHLENIVQTREVLRNIILNVLSKNKSKDDLLNELEVKGF